MADASRDYLKFSVGMQQYGIEAETIIEVLNFMLLKELPGAPADVLGVMLLRDLVIPVVDLRLRFGSDQAKLTLETPIIAVKTARGPVGLVVDDVFELVRVEAAQVTSHDVSDSPFVKGVAITANELLLLVDDSALYK